MSENLSDRLLKRSFLKRVFRNLISLVILSSLVYGVAALVYATKTIFKVKRNYAVVLEQFNGNRKAVLKMGWHVRLPFFTRIEQEVPLMNRRLFLGNKDEPMRIISKENVALWTSAVLTYRINNLERWAIDNLDALNLLQGDYDGIVKDLLQARRVSGLISGREEIKEEIFEALKSRPINVGGPTLESKYGIEVVSFVLKETRFGDKLVEATEEKKRRELIAEAENYAADQEASRIRKLYTAYLESIRDLQEAVSRPDGSGHDILFDFLVQQKWASAYEKNQTGQNTFVIQNAKGPVSMVLPPSKPAELKTDTSSPTRAKARVMPRDEERATKVSTSGFY